MGRDGWHSQRYLNFSQSTGWHESIWIMGLRFTQSPKARIEDSSQYDFVSLSGVFLYLNSLLFYLFMQLITPKLFFHCFSSEEGIKTRTRLYKVNGCKNYGDSKILLWSNGHFVELWSVRLAQLPWYVRTGLSNKDNNKSSRGLQSVMVKSMFTVDAFSEQKSVTNRQGGQTTFLLFCSMKFELRMQSLVTIVPQSR